MAKYTPNLNLYEKDPVADASDTFNIKTMMNDNWDKIDESFGNINQKVTNHLTEIVSESFYVSRDVSLSGIQTILLSNNKKPKEIKINSGIIGSKAISLGIWSQSGKFNQQSIFTEKNTGNIGTDATAVIRIAEDGLNYTVAKTQNISVGSFELNWSLNGSGGSGIAVLLISVLYHGED